MALSIEKWEYSDRGSSLGHSLETNKDSEASTVTNGIRRYSLSRIGHPELFTPSGSEPNTRPSTTANSDGSRCPFCSRNNN